MSRQIAVEFSEPAGMSGSFDPAGSPAAAVLAAAARRHGLGAAADYLALAKPRVVMMVLVTTVAGFYLAALGSFDYLLALETVIGTAIAAGGTLALNQYFERDLDARMARTRIRPLPSGRLAPRQALLFGALFAGAGTAWLWLTVNLLAALVTAAIAVIYLFAYTPLKRVSSSCSVVGAIPGALPPVVGWVAARGALGVEPLVLFSIMFLWQLPHSLAIAQLYRADYAAAGIRVLPTEDPRGGSTVRQIVVNSIALMAAAMLPTILGFAGAAYFVVATAAGAGLLVCAARLALDPAAATAARRVMFATLIYLPVVLLAMALDKL